MMKKPLFALIALLAMTACTGPKTETQAEKIPMEDFFKNPEKTGFQLSPDGEYFSYLAPFESRLNVFIQKVGDEEAIRITSESDRDISGYFWGNNKRILYLKDTGGDENFQLYGVNIDGTGLKGLTIFEGVRTQILDRLDEIEEEVIVGLNKRNPQVFDPYRLNIVSGELNIIAENPGNIVGWMTDHDGKLRIAIASDGVNQTYMYRATEADEWIPSLTLDFRQSIEPLLFTFDNEMIYATSNLNRDKSAIVLFDMVSGEEKEIIFETDEADVQYLSYSKKEKKILAAVYTTAKRQVHYFDDDAKAMAQKVEAKLPGVEVRFTSENKEEDKFMIRTFSDKSRGAYYLYDENTDDLIKLADLSPWLDDSQLCDMKPISYTSRDGLTIPGYLTLPKGYGNKNLPVVINPHGGPWARNNWGFNPEVQFLANNGYAVLQMNFRGSTGYGKAFWEASFKQWGQSMQDDISDGVQWLIDEGIADADRVAIYGGSYGGYATLAGLAFTPDLYAAGVDYVGVSNLFTLLKTIPPYWAPMLDMFHEMMGHPQEDSLLLRQISPVFHADKIVAPLFVAQGANDPRVNIAESDQIVKALEDQGIAVEYMVKDNEGHGFHNEENRFDFYRAMLAFLDKHLKSEQIE